MGIFAGENFEVHSLKHRGSRRNVLGGNLKVAIRNNTKMIASLDSLWRWVKGQWVAEVPDDIAVCEFDCRKSQCFFDEWACCGRRISKSAAELMPVVVRLTGR